MVTSNLAFSSLPNFKIAHCIIQNELVPSELLPKYQNASSQIWVWSDMDLANVPLKDVSMERVRVKEFGESKNEDCGWVNLVFLKVFSLKILSGNSLHFVGIRVHIVGWVRNANSQVSNKQDILAIGASRKFKSWANCPARLEVLSCSATASMTLQLPCMLHTCAIFSDSPVERSSRKALLECTFLSFSSHFLTHYPYMIPT